MIDLSQVKNNKIKQMHYALLSVLLIYVYFVQFSHINYSDSQSGKASAEEPAPVLIEKTEPQTVEQKLEDLFVHQIKKSEPLYNPIILEAASQHDVDLAMVKAIIMAESGFNRKSVSRNGAGGLMQLMPRTARSLGVKDVFNPEENIHAGVKYFKHLLERFDGDEKLALAAYNAGARNVRKYKGVPPFRETKKYIKKVLSYQDFYKNGPSQKKAASI